MKILKNVIISIFITLASSSTPTIAQNSPDDLLHRYLIALHDNQIMPPESVWVETDIARSKSLGITFEGVSLKIDCASPHVYGKKYLSTDSWNHRISSDILDSVTAHGSISTICSNGDSIVSNYYLTKENGRWRLCSPLYLFTKGWYTIESQYYKIIFSDSTLINSYAIEAIDNYTDSLAEVFDISDEKMEYLAERKIEYYLCDQDQMKLLTGHDAHGMTSFPFDAIITRHLPHPHEITHLLINYALEEIPLFTLPLVQEGLACCLGGRWGKSPAVIKYWGAAMNNLDLIDIDSILSVNGFYTCSVGVDGAYASSALLVEAIIENYGFDTFRQIYQRLSGDESYVTNLSPEDIQKIICKICNASWEDISRIYDNCAEANLSCGVLVNQPSGKHNSEYRYLCEEFTVTIIEDSLTSHFITQSNSEGDKGILLIGELDDTHEPKYSSWQYEQQTGNNYSSDIHYGICFDKGEIGLYDYYTNTLLAKYVHGFTPKSGFIDDNSKSIKFSIDLDQWSIDLDDYDIAVFRRM